MKFYKEGGVWLVRKKGDTAILRTTSLNYTAKIDNDKVSIYRNDVQPTHPHYILFEDVDVTSVEKNDAGEFYVDVADFITMIDGNIANRIIEVGDITYIATAALGTPDSSSAWNIQRISTSGDTTTIGYAKGVLDDYASLTYTE